MMRLLALFVLVLTSVAAQTTPSAPAQAAPADYKLGPGDVVRIGVFNVNELGRAARVSNSGRLHFPSAGVLDVAGLTATDLEQLIAKKLRDSGLVKDPVVQVAVTEFRAQPVYILGEVMMPGQFVINEQMRVMDLLTLAAGFNEVASKVGYLYRRKLKDQDSTALAPESTTDDEAILLDFPAITSGRNPQDNLQLRGGDILYVPVSPKNRYFVIGEVLKTGAFDLDREQRLLATEALARAGGPDKTAKLSEGIVVRYNTQGEREEVAVDFGAILRGKKPDFEIQPNDVIFLPGSKIKTLGYGLLNIIPSSAGRMAAMH